MGKMNFLDPISLPPPANNTVEESVDTLKLNLVTGEGDQKGDLHFLTPIP